MHRILFADAFTLTEGAERTIAAMGSILRLSLDERERFLELSREADVIVAEYASVDASILDRAENLKGVVSYGVGVNHIDLEEASKRGIPVANCQGGNAQAVAELAVSLMLECLRHTGEAHRYVTSGRWGAADSASLPEWMQGRELRGKTLGIIGPGNIGGRIAAIGEALGMKILVTSGRANGHPTYEWLPLEDLLSRSDIVSVNVLLTADTKGLLSGERLSLMKKGAVLIATSRGGIVDEEALAGLLRSGHLAGAGLDVFEREPLPATSPLPGAPNVVLTPHMGGSTHESVANISDIIVSCCASLLRGDIPDTTVNREMLRQRSSSK